MLGYLILMKQFLFHRKYLNFCALFHTFPLLQEEKNNLAQMTEEKSSLAEQLAATQQENIHKDTEINKFSQEITQLQEKNQSIANEKVQLEQEFATTKQTLTQEIEENKKQTALMMENIKKENAGLVQKIANDSEKNASNWHVERVKLVEENARIAQELESERAEIQTRLDELARSGGEIGKLKVPLLAQEVLSQAVPLSVCLVEKYAMYIHILYDLTFYHILRGFK